MQEPGWYPDPTDTTRLRFWDGARWTGQVRDATAADTTTGDADGDVPPPPTAPMTPVPGDADGDVPPPPTAPMTPVPDGTDRDVPPPPTAPTPPGSDDTDRSGPGRVLAIIGGVVVVLALVGGGAVLLLRDGDDPPTSVAVDGDDGSDADGGAGGGVVEDGTDNGGESNGDPDVGGTEAATPEPTAEPTPEAATLLPATRTGGAAGDATGTISYREVEDLGFTSASLAAAVADIDSDLLGGWVVSPDRTRLCQVSRLTSDPPATEVGPCHAPVLPDPAGETCRELRTLVPELRYGDPGRAAGSASALSGRVEDPVLAERLAIAAQQLPGSGQGTVPTPAALAFELGDLYCGALQRTSTAVPPSRDWDGARFDSGEIVSIARQPDGSAVVELDRYGVFEGGSDPVDGPDITRFPLVRLNSDVPWTNTNPQLRSFTVDEAALVYVMDPYPETCEQTDPPAPSWSATSLEELVASDAANPAAIRYDANGVIVEVGLGRSC